MAVQYFEQVSLTTNTLGRAQTRKKEGIQVKEKLIYLVSTIIFVVIGSLIIANYTAIAEYNYQIQQTNKNIKRIEEEKNKLQLKIAELSSPRRIIDFAQNQLGMQMDETRVTIISQ